MHALGSNLFLDKQILSIRQHKPFVILSGMQERVSILMNTFEPEEEIDLISQIDASDPSTLLLLALCNMFRTYEWLSDYQEIHKQASYLQQFLLY